MSQNKLSFENVFLKVLQLPTVRVNREKFLRNNLRRYCTQEQIDLAVSENTMKARVEKSLINKIAKNSSEFHRRKIALGSFTMGIPGGTMLIATIPADLAHYYHEVIVIAQKIAYLYGYPEFDNNADDEFMSELLVFIAVMSGVEGSNAILKQVLEKLSKATIKKIKRKAMTKTFYYNLIKKIGTEMGYKVTKETFSLGVAKIFPLVGGGVSGYISYKSFDVMSNRLRVKFEESYTL